MTQEKTGLDEAIKIVGSSARLARLLSISRGAVTQWKTTGLVPARRYRELEKATGIPRHRLNPEVFGVDA